MRKNQMMSTKVNNAPSPRSRKGYTVLVCVNVMSESTGKNHRHHRWRRPRTVTVITRFTVRRGGGAAYWGSVTVFPAATTLQPSSGSAPSGPGRARCISGTAAVRKRHPATGCVSLRLRGSRKTKGTGSRHGGVMNRPE